MSRDCGRTFDEAELTGYLDGVLTQSRRQRVRLHLEECDRCRRLVDEMRETREATMTTMFETPADDQWSELPRGLASRLSRGLGWLLLVIWLVGMTGLVVGHLWSDEMPLGEKLLIFGGITGIVLLFVSVLLDRLRILRTDPYRRVDK